MKKNKIYLYIIYLIIVIALIYTHSNTFLANDDIPYMFLYRTSARIDSILDILKNQYADYFNINGRVLVHSVLQLVLIFDKSLWSIINPIMILATIILLSKISELITTKNNQIISILLGISLYLSIIKFKKIIYWVAGSVNYVWVFVLLLIFLYLFYKYGFSKRKYLNAIIIVLLTAMHECTMVFAIIFIIGNMLIDYFQNKKFNKDYIIYLISLLGSLVLFLSPSNQARLVSDEAWNALNIFEKLLTSIPVISREIINLCEYKFILPYFFIIAIIIILIKNKDKISNIMITSIIINILLIYIIKNDWLYFLLIIQLLGSEIYSYFKKKQYNLCILNLSMYAVVYSNIISPTYAAGRPNYYFYMYMILIIIMTFNDLIYDKKNLKKASYFLLSITTILLLSYEVSIYHTIGSYHKERILQIEEYKNSNREDTLYLKKIPAKYEPYHMDINLPTKDWFNYKCFTYYYDLPVGIEIKYR